MKIFEALFIPMRDILNLSTVWLHVHVSISYELHVHVHVSISYELHVHVHVSCVEH